MEQPQAGGAREGCQWTKGHDAQRSAVGNARVARVVASVSVLLSAAALGCRGAASLGPPCLPPDNPRLNWGSGFTVQRTQGAFQCAGGLTCQCTHAPSIAQSRTPSHSHLGPPRQPASLPAELTVAWRCKHAHTTHAVMSRCSFAFTRVRSSVVCLCSLLPPLPAPSKHPPPQVRVGEAPCTHRRPLTDAEHSYHRQR
jgi:hypothetical protein